jgi:hypothetical protein
MATVTPNFNWPVPTSTDLVKDGATAIEALGDSIDASLVDLKGGTTGQVLSKNSNTDMDFVWVTDAAGDITGVTAGTGISGGGTSGTVTVTNSMATAIDAKGDLVPGTGADTFARLAVGANDTVLTADSTTATGLKWATPSSGGMTLISTTALSGASVTLSSIPQTYNSLKLIILGATNATADGFFTIQMNGSNNFYLSVQEGATNYQLLGGGFTPQNTSLRTNADNSFVFDVSAYTSTTTTNKPLSVQYFYVSTSGANWPSVAGGMSYINGAALTSIVISNTGGNLNGGTAYLYGVK